MAKTSGKKDKGDKVLPKGVSGKKVKDNLKKGKSSELDKSKKKKKSSSDSTNSSSSSDAAHVWTPEEMQKFCAIGSGFGLLLVSSGFGTYAFVLLEFFLLSKRISSFGSFVFPDNRGSPRSWPSSRASCICKISQVLSSRQFWWA